ncbi:Hsp20/alpha crystallin family protein [Allokutzneria sp. NRRL B-24872]|uniref:Hsp20/alpha crystallin family protein n=1 Tax=Allokutzneria sp. NRRL B-24872 TaxID=1137961 RepID=UPI00143D6EB0|nr:Hsp20/alpha crystallin family protein [Allokutzneria sp. NRRL B-24872]
MPEVLHRLKNGFPFTLFTARQQLRLEDRVTDDDYVLRAELPGVNPDDIKVTVKGGDLSIEAERTDEKQEKTYSEFHYGAVKRTVSLPPSVNPSAVEARYEGGILEVRMPRRDIDEEHRIPVKRM